MEHNTDELAKILWNYHHTHHVLQGADCIVVLGSRNLQVARYGAKLFLQQFAPLLVCSGGFGRITKNEWSEPEANIFAKIMITMGVPKERIFIENRSTNTGENILFTEKLLKKYNIPHRLLIFVHKPYMERRTYAMFKKLFKNKKVKCIVTSPPISYEDYLGASRSKDDVINAMVSNLQKIRLYAEKGFQIRQKIPKNVKATYQKLLARGYTKQLIAF